MDGKDESGKKLPKVTKKFRTVPPFVATKSFQRVASVVENGETPLLVVGRGGSGKTTLLTALANRWVRTSREVIFLSLHQVGSGEEVTRELRRQLAKYSRLPDYEDSIVVGGSSRSALRATADLIESAPKDLLIIFDGLDAIPDPSEVMQLLSVIPKAIVVASSRMEPAGTSYVFRSVVQVLGFSRDEAAKFIDRRRGPKLDQNEIDNIYRFSEGSPLTLSLTLDLVKQGIIPDLALLNLHVPTDMLFMRLIDHALSGIDPNGRAEYFRALVSLAVLNRPVQESEYPGRILRNNLTVSILQYSDEIGIFFRHASFPEAILSSANLTTDSKNTLLSSLKFGAEEAERDSLLSKNFISLAEFSDVVSGEINIVVGDRGTGKSAMFNHLSKPGQNASLKVPLVKPLTHPAEMLRRLEANGSPLSTADQFRAGWMTLVAYCVADEVKTFSSPAHARAALYLKEMLGSESQTGWMLIRFFKGLVGRVLQSSVKIKLGPVEIDPAGTTRPKGAASIDLGEFIKDAAKSLAAAGRIALIPLDRVDEIHKYARELQKKAVQGLFLAEGDLAQLESIRLVIFLRSDLFKTYGIEEKNKLGSRSMLISWTKPQLLQFLIDRVLSNSCLHPVRELVDRIPRDNPEVAMAALFPSEIEGMPMAEWLWEWMENGNGDVSPRQLVLLLMQAAKSPVAKQTKMDNLPIFPASALQWGMKELSDLSFNELIDDFKVAPTFLANCRAGRVKVIELAKVESLFSKDEGPVSAQVELLVQLGFLERVILENPDGTKTSHFEVPKLFTRSWGVA